MSITGYDSWATSNPDEPIHSFCHNCDGELYVGTEAVECDDEFYCDKQCLLESLNYRETYLEDFREGNFL